MMGMRQFELLEDLEAYGTAPAVLLKFDGKQYVRTKELIEVRDFVGSHGDKTDRGYTFLSDESNCWEVSSGLFQREPVNRW